MSPSPRKLQYWGWALLLVISHQASLLLVLSHDAVHDCWYWALWLNKRALSFITVTIFVASAYVSTFTCCSDFVMFSARASFWGDAYTVRKWTINLRTKTGKCVPTKRNRETNAAFRSTFSTKFIKPFSEIKWSSRTMRAFLSHTRVCSVIVCVTFCLRRVETESGLLRRLYASLPWFCVQLDFCALTQPPHVPQATLLFQSSVCLISVFLILEPTGCRPVCPADPALYWQSKESFCQSAQEQDKSWSLHRRSSVYSFQVPSTGW